MILNHRILDTGLYIFLSYKPCYLDTQHEQRIRVYSSVDYQRMSVNTNKTESFHMLYIQSKDHMVKASKG